MNVAGGEPSVRITRDASLSVNEILEEMQQQVLRGPPLHQAATSARSAATSNELRLAEMLAHGGAAFVERAFIGVLRRPPDNDALTYYAGQLATGERNKIEILGALRYSAEGRKVGTRVPGLLSRYVVVRSYRIYGIGPLIASLVRAIRWPRRLRRSQMELSSGMASLHNRTDGLQGAILSLQRRVERLEAADVSQPGAQRLEKVEEQLVAMSLESWAEPMIALAAQVNEQVRRTRLLEQQASDIVAVSAVLRGLRAEHGWPNEDSVAFATRLASLSRDVVRRAAQADETTQRNRAEVLDQSRRLALLLADVRRRLDQPLADAEANRLEKVCSHLLDPLYVAFEDRFRGNRADILNRQRAHLPLIREAGAGSKERPIVDLGAGRGEWLELLGEAGLRAAGVDLNQSMVDLCCSLGLHCTCVDAIEYLRDLADNSLGAVTGFHIIEHLRFTTFVRLLDESLRVLRPDGVILLETPNPANLLVSSRLFYLDPTHRNPMPAEMTAMIAEERGFVRVHVRELHPMTARFQARDDLLAAELDRMFHGPQDYLLVARKP